MLGLIACCSIIASMFFRVSTLLWEFSADNIFSSGPILTAICKSFCTRVDIGIDNRFTHFNTSITTISYLATDCKILYHARLFNLSLPNISYMPFFNVNLKPKKSAISFIFWLKHIVLKQHKSETKEINVFLLYRAETKLCWN